MDESTSCLEEITLSDYVYNYGCHFILSNSLRKDKILRENYYTLNVSLSFEEIVRLLNQKYNNSVLPKPMSLDLTKIEMQLAILNKIFEETSILSFSFEMRFCHRCCLLQLHSIV
ncbi:hypothetical protein Anas_02727 [Armadillidium nasatum]|uniref:Uncharacterized protein n=1 Tax=Armadillidium nasatum TaxID=96803 RepID=A0A5N5TNT3_9CRUS|nr:hypothetical protein Anas_02727 [Armadillidium nasatum]